MRHRFKNNFPKSLLFAGAFAAFAAAQAHAYTTETAKQVTRQASDPTVTTVVQGATAGGGTAFAGRVMTAWEFWAANHPRLWMLLKWARRTTPVTASAAWFGSTYAVWNSSFDAFDLDVERFQEALLPAIEDLRLNSSGFLVGNPAAIELVREWEKECLEAWRRKLGMTHPACTWLEAEHHLGEFSDSELTRLEEGIQDHSYQFHLGRILRMKRWNWRSGDMQNWFGDMNALEGFRESREVVAEKSGPEVRKGKPPMIYVDPPWLQEGQDVEPYPPLQESPSGRPRVGEDRFLVLSSARRDGKGKGKGEDASSGNEEETDRPSQPEVAEEARASDNARRWLADSSMGVAGISEEERMALAKLKRLITELFVVAFRDRDLRMMRIFLEYAEQIDVLVVTEAKILIRQSNILRLVRHVIFSWHAKREYEATQIVEQAQENMSDREIERVDHGLRKMEEHIVASLKDQESHN